ncbi:MAG: hypothetical protein KVP17_003950 [Porospora cf. gigantea B]|uniref:uncharacterized protein n=1 Tax=Porospora cf. gigantea B TaxID=2853592 RepID=UPI003571DB8B|nr:MAG: hypothetical protein KVP17_003950 [Porospora cf. gigantea B]
MLSLDCKPRVRSHGTADSVDPSHSFRFNTACQTDSILAELPYTDGSGDVAYLTVRDGKPTLFSTSPFQGNQKVTLVANRIEAGTLSQHQVMVFENSDNILLLRRSG